MIYAYIRVSTDKQTVENQRFELRKFAAERGIAIDKWVSETVSGTKAAKDRKLGGLLRKMRKGDTLLISEISRLGRNLMGIMSALNLCMTKETRVLTVKERYELDAKDGLIRRMLSEGCSKAAVCRRVKCSYITLMRHLKRKR